MLRLRAILALAAAGFCVSCAFAVTSAKRASFVPELPTVAEAGVPGFEATGWYGLLGPTRILSD